MTEISIDCFRCLTKNMGAKPRAAFYGKENEVSVFATCNKCGVGVVIYGEAPGPAEKFRGQNVFSVAREDSFLEFFKAIETVPAMPKPKEVQYLPAHIHRTLSDAEFNFINGRNDPAAIFYRKAIEQTFKDMEPEQEGAFDTGLKARIKRAAQDHIIPKELADLARQVKFLGDNAAHGKDEVDRPDLEAGRELTILFLTYLFELPERIKRADTARQARGK